MRGDTKVTPLRSPHPHGIVLTTLTAANAAERLFPNTAKFRMSGSVQSFFDYTIPFERVVFVNKFNTGHNLGSSGFKMARPGTFNKHEFIIVICQQIWKYLLNITAVALLTKPYAVAPVKLPVATHATAVRFILRVAVESGHLGYPFRSRSKAPAVTVTGRMA